MKRLLLLVSAVMLVGCGKQAVQPVRDAVTHDAQGNLVDTGKPPCNPSIDAEMGETHASTKLVTPAQTSKPYQTYPHCADNQRIVFPSPRETARLGRWTLNEYGLFTKSDGSAVDSDDEINVEYSHALCVPDRFKSGGVK